MSSQVALLTALHFLTTPLMSGPPVSAHGSTQQEQHTSSVAHTSPSKHGPEKQSIERDPPKRSKALSIKVTDPSQPTKQRAPARYRAAPRPQLVSQRTQQSKEQEQLSPARKLLKDIHLRLVGRTFPGFHATWLPNQDFSEFEVHESVLGMDIGWSRYLGASVRFEILRSAQPQSLFGIDGDSYILRLQRAWGYARYPLWIGWIEARFGLIPDPWIAVLRPGYRMRGLRALLSESGDFFEQSDMGASIHYKMLRGALEIGFAFTNGEGLHRAEQNAGKNSTIVLSIRPLQFLKKTLMLWGDPVDIALHGTYRDGSIGVGSGSNHRIAGALTITSRFVDLGAEYIYATGWAGQPDRNADGLGIWARGSLGTRWIGLFVRYDRQNTNADIDDAVRQRISAGLYSDLLDARLFQGNQRFRLYLAYQYESQGANAMPLPGVPQLGEAHRLLVLLSIYLDAHFNRKAAIP